MHIGEVGTRTVARFFYLLAVAVITASPVNAQERAGLDIGLCGTLPSGPGLPAGVEGLVDRFNYPWKAPLHLKAHQEKRAQLLRADCGGFRVDFEDVILGTGLGFDDPKPVNHPVLGTTTLGEVRRRTVCEVFGYLGTILELQGSPDVIVQKSLSKQEGFIAAASPFFTNGGSGFVGGTMYDHITRGTDPTPSTGDYDARLIFNFGYGMHGDWSTPPAADEIDLYSVTLHEITHTLGFMSLISPDGSSDIGGGYALFDRRLHDGAGNTLLDPATAGFRSTTETLLSNGIMFDGTGCRVANPVYSPNPYKQGSSLSHFDEVRSGIRYVMRWATSGGSDRVYTEVELQTLCELGYRLANGLCGNCAPHGLPDYGATSAGEEVCIDVTGNDEDRDGDAITIDPASLRIEVGGGSLRIEENRFLCYTPPADFFGVGRIIYRPTDGRRSGDETVVEVNVTQAVQLNDRKDTYIWYFGTNAGLSFAGGAPKAVFDGKLRTFEGCAVASDQKTGELLFYSDGAVIWNREHEVMRNGAGLLGHASSTQAALIVKQPGDDHSRFYIFTTGASESNNGLRYSIVDMAARGGLGEVIQRNVVLIPPQHGTEMLAGTRHCNGEDYWIVSHEWGTDIFHSYLLTDQGIADTVLTPIGPVLPRDIVTPIGGPPQLPIVGSIAISPNSALLAFASSYLHRLDLFDFDSRNGAISNQRVLADSSIQAYSTEFSPDNSKLYVSDFISLFQFDVAAGSGAEIVASGTELPLYGKSSGQLQLGPDGRIYHSRFGETQLGVIAEPNKAGRDCNYILNGISIAPASLQHGLPNFIDADIQGSEHTTNLDFDVIVDNADPVYGDTVIYQVSVCNSSDLEWKGVEIEARLPTGLKYSSGFSRYPRHGIDQIAPGQCVEIRLHAIVTPDLPLETPVAACFTYVGAAEGGGCLTAADNCADIIAHGLDISVEKWFDRDSAASGDEVRYFVAVTNHGPIPADEIIVQDVLPKGSTYVSHQEDAGSRYDPLTGVLKIGHLESGRQSVLTVACRVNDEEEQSVEGCAELVDVYQTDLDETNNRSCAALPIVDCVRKFHARIHAGRKDYLKLGITTEIPVLLNDSLDQYNVRHIRMVLEYDIRLLQLMNGSNPVALVRNTLLEGWTPVSIDNTPGRLTVEYQAPDGTPGLGGPGTLLLPAFRMYLGPSVETELPLDVSFPERCYDLAVQPGRARLDSICGLNFRLIEVGPESYALDENRPNPFNPSTVLPFSVGMAGPTRLEVYNAAGEQVAVLVDEYLEAGRYEVTWDADGYPSGLYYYRLVSGHWSRTRSMMLVK